MDYCLSESNSISPFPESGHMVVQWRTPVGTVHTVGYVNGCPAVVQQVTFTAIPGGCSGSFINSTYLLSVRYVLSSGLGSEDTEISRGLKV